LTLFNVHQLAIVEKRIKIETCSYSFLLVKILIDVVVLLVFVLGISLIIQIFILFYLFSIFIFMLYFIMSIFICLFIYYVFSFSYVKLI
jgi:hypothetical protein